MKQGEHTIKVKTHTYIKLTTTENPWFYLFPFYVSHNNEHENDILDF